ncbi:hypothetical protein SAMN05443428_101245 [Caloramator quimbayensis]|uniref:YhfM-like domain-containing protein n=1 Tax=Caloramator quimbayensis TaxID=1147123 RepID=A0A1T4WHC8_9CLOT|nr:hypothetical protein [Caloramator quimbayensis]SKA76692.1 hypothetical protein SAMN05443428_101245 [Caloramator quimbayensis]
MKKIILLLIIPFLFTSCIGGKKNQNLMSLGLNKDIERITVTNNKYAGKYTIIDKKTIERFSNTILEAKDAKSDSGLESDFTFEFYSESKSIASFKYIAGIDDESTANLYDDKGRLYHVDNSIEDEFINRLMKKGNFKHVSEYYESLLSLIFEKTNIQKGQIAVVDIRKDFLVTKYITSIEQKKMIESIDNKGITVKFPKEAEKYDYYILIDTRKYNDNTCKTYVTVTDSLGSKVIYVLEGNYIDSKWSYYIKFK